MGPVTQTLPRLEHALTGVAPTSSTWPCSSSASRTLSSHVSRCSFLLNQPRFSPIVILRVPTPVRVVVRPLQCAPTPTSSGSGSVSGLVPRKYQQHAGPSCAHRGD